MAGLVSTAVGQIVTKNQPFTPKDEKSGKPGDVTYYGVELGFMGGFLKLACTSEQYADLKEGDNVQIQYAASTNGGKTKCVLKQYKKQAA